MADLTGTAVATNYLKNSISTGLGGRTQIVKLAGTNLTNDDLNQVIAYLTTSHGVSGSGDDAFTVSGFGTADGSAFVSGTTDTVYLALQGTGDFTAATADCGISGLTVSVEAVFVQA